MEIKSAQQDMQSAFLRFMESVEKEQTMKILMLGGEVIGTTYSEQISNAGYDVTLLVRKPNREKIERDGIHIRCKDE
jgi:pyruvate/2-oxoglutarate dehydrogenase complex dihydrolipoamide dehydrogenase (E3) component